MLCVLRLVRNRRSHAYAWEKKQQHSKLGKARIHLAFGLLRQRAKGRFRLPVHHRQQGPDGGV
jgi:hypothetical protein